MNKEMNNKLMLTLFTSALLISMAQAENICKLRLRDRDWYQWQQISTGFLASFYSPPPEGRDTCYECQQFGYSVANLHESIIKVEKKRPLWLNKNAIVNLSFLALMTQMLQIYPLFNDLLKNAIAVIKNPVFSGVLKDSFGLMKDEQGQTTVQEAVKSNVFLSYSVYQSIPGSDCYLIGYKSGVPVRMMLGIVADPATMNAPTL